MNPQLFTDLATSEESSGYPENARALRAVPGMIEALRMLPDDVDMIEHNPDEGQSFFCCGERTSLNHGIMNHANGCWYVAARAALAALDATNETENKG